MSRFFFFLLVNGHRIYFLRLNNTVFTHHNFVYPFSSRWMLGLLFFWPIVNVAMNMAVQVSL